MAGDQRAAALLPWILLRHGEADEAIRMIRHQAEAGDLRASTELAFRPVDVDEAIAVGQQSTDVGDDWAAGRPAELHKKQARSQEAIIAFRPAKDLSDQRVERMVKALTSRAEVSTDPQDAVEIRTRRRGGVLPGRAGDGGRKRG